MAVHRRNEAPSAHAHRPNSRTYRTHLQHYWPGYAMGRHLLAASRLWLWGRKAGQRRDLERGESWKLGDQVGNLTMGGTGQNSLRAPGGGI